MSPTLQWHHNEHDGISNHLCPYLVNRLFRRSSKKTSKFSVIGLCEGNPPVTSVFPSQRVSNAENVSIWCCHYEVHNYNMVGVVVAMVISTMHEKSCIDSHNAWKFEKSSKIQSFTHLAITMMKLRKHHSHEFLVLSFRKLFLTKLSQDSYLNYHWFH